MDNRWSLKKWLLQLSAPYKKSEAYKKFEDVRLKDDSDSRFWNTDIEYVIRYENAKLRKPTSNSNK